MSESLVINKNRTLLSSEDYNFLREEGQKYLEALGSELWTDYNIHDPGVTILEALCFAISDLGYRTEFDIKDILEDDPDGAPVPQLLFTAGEILTCNPVTETDWRKVLVDVDGVHNAWLYLAEDAEVDFHAECESSELKYFDPNEVIKFEDLGYGSFENDLLASWNESEENTESQAIYLKDTITYPADDGFGHVVDRHLELNVKFPGWLTIYNEMGKYFRFINHNFEGETNFVSLVNVNYNQSARTWTGNLRIDFPSNPALSAVRIIGVEVKNITGNAQVFALQSYLLEGSMVALYRDLLHKQVLKLIKHEIRLRGLYEVLLEFDNDDVYGDLNSPAAEYTITYKKDGVLKDFDMEILFPSWQSIFDNLEFYDEFIKASGLDSVSFSNSYYDIDEDSWEADLELFYTGDSGPDSRVFNKVVFNGIKNEEQRDQLITEIPNSAEAGIAGFFHNKLKRIHAIYMEARACLHARRNLCEDWLKITGVNVCDVAVCADIELRSDANIEDVLASIYFEIEEYFSPDIRFYSLKEMTDKGIVTEEIFEGPVLEHGFIIDSEIEDAKLRSTIYTSDLINILMDIDGIIAVRDVLLTKYDENGDPVLPSARWCLEIPEKTKPRLNKNKSKILFFKDDLPFKLSDEAEDKMEFKYNQLKAIAEKGKLITTPLDFELPEGTYWDLENYSSVRKLFPQTYGIGEAGLSEEESDERKAKAIQLKAFLTFFDQMLANYFSQLKNVKELFSVKEYVSPTEERTYFEQYLEENEIGGSLYVDAVKLQDQLHGMTEDEETYLDRRNRFLDHLLSRFAEDFTEFTLLMQSIDGLRAPRELIRDKISYLEEYNVISSERGKAFDYTDEAELWNTSNVSGLEKRVSKMLGMESYDRRFLHCPTICDRVKIFTIGTGPGNPPKFGFLLEDSGLTLLRSTKNYDSRFEARLAVENLLDLMADLDNYHNKNEAGKFHVYVRDGILPIAKSTHGFDSEDEATSFSEALRKRIRLDFEVFARLQTELRKKPNDKYVYELKIDGTKIVNSISEFADEYIAWTAREEFLLLAVSEDNYELEPKPSGKFAIVVKNDVKNVARFVKQYDDETEASLAILELVELFTTINPDCLDTE